MRKKKGYFSISAVAQMFSIHQQTIRLYEKEGLIKPKRSAGGTRLFMPEDIEKLEEIVYLTHQLGINLAGVELILKLKKRIKRMQKEMNDMFDHANQELETKEQSAKEGIQQSAKRLMEIKKESSKSDKNKTQEDKSPVDLENWEIHYDE